MNHIDSPLFDKEQTFYIKNIQTMSDSDFLILLNFIQDAQLHLNNQLIFSLNDSSANPNTQQYIRYLTRFFNCATLKYAELPYGNI